MNVTKPVAFKRGIKITLTFTFFATIVLCSLLSQADAQQQQQGTKTRRNRGMSYKVFHQKILFIPA